jgi:phage shock protein A
MFSFLRKLLVRIMGWFQIAGDNLVSSSPESIKSTYAAAIQEAYREYKSMQEGLGMIMQQATRIKGLWDSLKKEMQITQAKLDGAIELADQEPDDLKHKEAGSKYLVRLDELKVKVAEQQKNYDNLTKMVADYKVKLIAMKVQIDDLKREQAEMQVEFIAAHSTLRLEEKLQGISTTSAVDESILAIREKVENMKAQVKVASEMRGAEPDEAEYAEVGAEKQAQVRFDELLKARQEAKTAKEVTPIPQPTLVKERDLG